jgi:GNAT superfamily N-acetyltransferase
VLEQPSIVPARVPDDICVVRALMREYTSELGIDLGFQGFEDELHYLPGEYTPPRGRLLVVRAGEGLVGMAAIRPLDDDACELKRMYLQNSWRGHGLGRRLAVAAIEAAREAGYQVMRLDTLSRLEPALVLYRSMGFVEIPAFRVNPCEDVVYLELDLTATVTASVEVRGGGGRSVLS